MDSYVSLNRVLEEVYQTEGYAQELDWGDAVTWAGKALRLIGAPAVYIEKVTGNSLLTPHIDVEDYRGTLPLDFVEMLPAGVRDSTSKEVYYSSSDSFRSRPAIHGEDLENKPGHKTYVIKNKYIEISEATATLELAYKAFLTDEEGFPMIPDKERVIEAIRAFITFRTDHKLWRSGRISREVYIDSEQEWLWAVGSAQTALRILTPDERAQFTKYWTRLLPVVNSQDYSYAYMNNREDLNIGFNRDNI